MSIWASVNGREPVRAFLEDEDGEPTVEVGVATSFLDRVRLSLWDGDSIDARVELPLEMAKLLRDKLDIAIGYVEVTASDGTEDT